MAPDQSKFEALSEATVPAFLEAHPALAERLGGSAPDWAVREVGDGNINFVYVITGPAGGLVIKQALPYIRCVGESWPMTVERINFEAQVLQEEFRLVPQHVPQVYLHSPPQALIAMEYLAPPHIILRKGLVQGLPYPLLADHVSTFLAQTLFGTSLIANTTATFRPQVAKYSANVDMCRLTEQVIFTEPYFEAANNRWTTPQLDADARAVREDDVLKVAIGELKKKFCESAGALLHGDLHTGSIMATAQSTKVIDPEFAFYGPMGFDIGAFLGNLFLAFFSQDGHATPDRPREEYKKWILETIAATWSQFEDKFRALWSARSTGPDAGDAYAPAVYNSPELVRRAQDAYLSQLLSDSLGFAGAKMIRRIVGIAHVEDLESIEDADVRAQCERRALAAGKTLVKQRGQFTSIAQAVSAVVSL